jgi:hypothetical protein
MPNRAIVTVLARRALTRWEARAVWYAARHARQLFSTNPRDLRSL